MNKKDWHKEYREHLDWNRKNKFRGGYIPEKCLMCQNHIDLCHCSTGHSICQNQDKPNKVYEFCPQKEQQMTIFDFMKEEILC